MKYQKQLFQVCVVNNLVNEMRRWIFLCELNENQKNYVRRLNKISGVCTFRCFYLQSGEAVALVAGQLCIDEFSEKKLPEIWSLKKSSKFL